MLYMFFFFFLSFLSSIFSQCAKRVEMTIGVGTSCLHHGKTQAFTKIGRLKHDTNKSRLKNMT